MYKRFKRSLFAPSELALHLKDSWLKVWSYFFLLLILCSAPFLMIVYANTGFSNQEKLILKENFKEYLGGSHKIEDGQLTVEVTTSTQIIYFRMDIYTIGLIEAPSNLEYQGVRMILAENGLNLSMFGLPNKTYRYAELGLENFDFENHSSQNIDRFIIGLNTIVTDYSVQLKVYQTFSFLISTFIELLFFALIAAAFSRYPLPFKYKFKIAIYVLSVYVIASLFALFTNSGLFIFVGIIFMMINMRRAFSKLTMV